MDLERELKKIEQLLKIELMFSSILCVIAFIYLFKMLLDFFAPLFISFVKCIIFAT